MDITRQKQLLFIRTVESLLSKNMKGQTLIEVLLALGTAVVVLSATVVAVLSALNNAQFSKNQNIATQYAQEGMEVMRNMRNSNWTLFSSYASDQYCLNQNSTDLSGRNRTIQGCAGGSSTNGQNVGIYARQVDIEANSSDCSAPTPPPPGNPKKVTVSVSWISNKCTRENLYCHSVKLVSCLGNP